MVIVKMRSILTKTGFNAYLMSVGNDGTKSVFSKFLNAESATMECEPCISFVFRRVLYTLAEIR